MTQIAIRATPVPLSLELGDALRLDDGELYELCRRNPDLRIERTREGDLVLMTPAGGETGRRNAEIVAVLAAWAKRDGTGVVTDSSTGFVLPDGAMLAPDAAWIARERWDAVPAAERERFMPLAPDFVVELRSPSDAPGELEAKMEEWVACGVRLGWLIDPFERKVGVYREQGAAEVLEGVDRVTGEPELPGLVLELGELWQRG